MSYFGIDAMKSKRSVRLFSKTMTSVGLALSVSACSTVYQQDWKERSDVPDLNDPAQRSVALLDYCKKLRQKGNLHLAAGICNRAHEVDPTNPEPLIALAQVMEDLKLTNSAIEAYRAALLIDPQQNDALYGLSKIYINQQQYDLAMAPLEAAVIMETQDPRIYNALGVVMDQQGQHVSAQSYYHQGLAFSPRNVSLRNNLGLSMVLNGQAEEGIAMLREVAAEPEAEAMASRNLAMAAQIVARTQPGHTMSRVPQPEADSQTSEDRQTGESRKIPTSRADWPEDDLPTLSPSTGATEDSGPGEAAPPATPLPLLEPYHHQSGLESLPTKMQAPKKRGAPTIDQEIVAATNPIAEKPARSARPAYEPTPRSNPQVAVAETAKPARQETTKAEPKAATARPTPVRDKDSAAAVPTPGPARYTGSPSSQAPAQQVAVAPKSDRAAAALANESRPGAPSEPSPNWSLAAQAVFATSMAEVPPAPRATVQDRLVKNDAIHAAPARKSATTAKATTEGPLADISVEPASTDLAPLASQSYLASQTYSVDGGWFYTAQLASYYSAERAREGWETLRESAGEVLEDKNAHIVRADLGEPMGIVFRVRAGTMTDHAAATQFCQELAAKGLECMPVKASHEGTAKTLVDKICQSSAPDAFCGSVQRSDLIDDDGTETAS